MNPAEVDTALSIKSSLDESVVGYDIQTLQLMMEQEKLTARALIEAYLHRIELLDRQGPTLNAVIEVNPDALSIADRLDFERREGQIRGPLHGIPVLLKDNIDSGDRMATSAGSLAMKENRAAKDAFLVERLRIAGAVILGKSNMSEWANFRSTKSTSGWSSRGGQTNNPRSLGRNPSGSSSGSAAAVAANLCAVAVGTETNGSIVAPSSACGIVGLKPTVGLVSRSGIIPVSPTCDIAGPMARTVTDAAILLSALAGVDPKDEVTLRQDRPSDSDYTQFLTADALKNKRIGVERAFLRGDEGVVSLYRKAIAALENAGVTVVEVELVERIESLNDSALTVFKYEFKPALEKYLTTASVGIKSLAEIVHFNHENRARMMPHFGQEIFEECLSLGNLNSPDYRNALECISTSRAVIDETLAMHQLDALAGTTFGLPDPLDHVFGDRDVGFYFGLPAALSGYPHITVPMGSVGELPLGISFMTGAFKEPLLLSIAFAYEQATKNSSH